MEIESGDHGLETTGREEMEYTSTADFIKGLVCSTPNYRIVGQKKRSKSLIAVDRSNENVASAPATPADSMNISVVDLK